MSEDDRKRRFMDEIRNADKSYWDKALYVPGDEALISEPEAGMIYDLWLKHPDVPAAYGVGRLGNFQHMPSKTAEQAAIEMLEDYIRSLGDLPKD